MAARKETGHVERHGTNREYTKNNGNPAAIRDRSRKYGKKENKNKPCGSKDTGVNSAFNIQRYKYTCKCVYVCLTIDTML